MENQKSEIRKLVEYLVKNFLFFGFVAAVLSIASAITGSHIAPVAVNSSYMEEIASGGAGTAVATSGSAIMVFAHYACIVATIAIVSIFVIKTVLRVREYYKSVGN